MLYTQEIKNIPNTNIDSLFDINSIISEFKSNLMSSDIYECFSIAYRREDLNQFIEFANFIRSNFKKVIVIGIGGSSLGTKVFLQLLKNSNVEVLESIDNNTIEIFLENLDINNTAFLTISKSGKTIECLSQTLLIMNYIKQKDQTISFNKHFFFLTEKKNNILNTLAKKFDIKVLEHNPKIGGRFSYLSSTILIPAAIAGLDIQQIRAGSQYTLDYFLNNNDNFIKDAVLAQFNLKNTIVANVIMSYVDRLHYLNDWYRQLWAESTGKNGHGIIPISGIGTADQHSQLQLYLEGTKNIFYTFLCKEEQKESIKIEDSYIDDLKFLKNISLDKIMDIELNSTIEVLSENKLPIRIVKFKKISEYSVSQLLMQFMLETVIYSNLIRINPFGQPAVEKRKIIAQHMLKNV